MVIDALDEQELDADGRLSFASKFARRCAAIFFLSSFDAIRERGRGQGPLLSVKAGHHLGVRCRGPAFWNLLLYWSSMRVRVDVAGALLFARAAGDLAFAGNWSDARFPGCPRSIAQANATNLPSGGGSGGGGAAATRRRKPEGGAQEVCACVIL